MYNDLQGYPLTNASTAALDVYQRAVTAFNFYHGDPIGLLDSAIDLAPRFTMAHLARVLMLALSSEPAAIAAAREGLAALKGAAMTPREQSLAAAAALLLAGRWREASRAMDFHNISYPRDLLALQTGHLLDFYCADSRNLRERVARALPEWDADLPGYALVLGMYAFGLEEDGHYSRAEEAGRRALALEPRDCWAHHAVAHVMEMQGRPEDGIGWMIAREAHWSDEENFFRVHNWWHRAVFHLDLGQAGEALALYDGAVRGTASSVALDLVDASALLWRLELAGVDTGTRWQVLADQWLLHADGVTYPFNDWHAAMALLGAERHGELELLVKRMEAGALDSPVAAWIAAVGLPLVRGFADFRSQRWQSAVEILLPVRRISGLFGGSHAQRDIIDLTLITAAQRGGIGDTARALVNERAAVRPHSHMTTVFREGLVGSDRKTNVHETAGGVAL